MRYPCNAMLQPYYTEENRRFYTVSNATPAMMRAAAANFQAKEVDGLYTWFMAWPLGEAERNTLTELGRRGLIEEGDKHYFLCRKPESEHVLGYEALLPIQIDRDDLGKAFSIPFSLADDPQNAQVQSIVAQAQYHRPSRGGSPRGGAERRISRRGSVPALERPPGRSVHRAMAGIPPRKGAAKTRRQPAGIDAAGAAGQSAQRGRGRGCGDRGQIRYLSGGPVRHPRLLEIPKG